MLAGEILAQAPSSAPSANPPAQPSNPWAYSLTVDGYIVPNGTGYASPTFTADKSWLHLEGRYNYEALRTGSLWAGYNFSWGKKVVLNLTPMLGAVFGELNGLAPGCEASLTYKKLELSITNEYVIDPNHSSNNFYYTFPEITYSPVEWFRFGYAAQRTRAYQTPLDVQRGFLIGFSHKKWEATTYLLNVGFTDPTVILEVGVSF